MAERVVQTCPTQTPLEELIALPHTPSWI